MHRLLCLLLLLCSGCAREGAGPMDVADALGGAVDAGFARATAQREFRFPRDHSTHDDFRNEWWYVTGQLQAEDGERFGYQVTFFRIALAPDAAARDSDWATRQLWMAHAALTEIDRAGHHHAERLARGALGLAGQQAAPFGVWLEDWSISGTGERVFPWQLQLDAGSFSLALNLAPQRAPVLQGDAGLSQKGAAPGNASYYYSITRLETRGEIIRGGETVEVSGLSWLDREWSTSALDDNQAGWDWFSLQLESGDDLMLYRLRDLRGETDPHSAGSLLQGDDTTLTLRAGQFELTPLRWWRSPGGSRYPVAWQLRIPDAGLDLHVEALLDSQEMKTLVRYWEGAVGVWSADRERRLGQGYLEMTGYND